MEETLWFDMLWPILVAMPFLGVFAAGISRRREPTIEGGRVLRHDGPARLAHWTHALGTVFLLVSGIVLGSRFTPAFVTDSGNTALWFNIHFVWAAIFLFGTFYWLGNTVISSYRFREHLPRKTAVKDAINHYGSLLKIKGLKMPEEEKYFESERLAFLAALGGAALMVATGLVKALSHLFDIPGPILNVVNWAHDIGALLMLLFLAAHVFFGVLLPVAWKSFPSIFTGYVPIEVAKHEYPLWVQAIEAQQGATSGELADVDAGATASAGVAAGAKTDTPADAKGRRTNSVKNTSEGVQQ